MPANTFISMYQLLVKLLQVWLALLLIALINIAQALPAEEISRSINQVSTPNLGEEKEILVVGSEEDYPPFSTGMTDATAGGFTIDLWKAVAAEAKVKYTLRVRPFHVLLEEFKAGKIDVLTNLAISKERHKFADFTIPHAVIHGGIFVREIDASKINSESDLNEKSIIVVNADMANEYVISKGLGKQLIKVNNATEGMQLLSSGKYDAMLINKVTGLQALQTLGIRNIKLIKTNAGFEQKFSFAVLEGHSELLSKINEALVITKSKGTYDKLYEKWFGIYDEKEVTLIDVLNWLLPVLVAFLAIALYAIHKRRVEIKISQAQLKASETHLRLSQKVGGIGTWEADLINNTQYWSENCIELLGLHAIKRPTWEDFLNLIHEDDRQYVIDSTKSHIEHGTKYAPEYRMVDSSGSIRWLRSTGQVECNIDGTPIKMRGIAQDITEHKLAEANLIKAEKFSSAVIESSPIPLAVNDDHGNITYLNPAFLHLVGYSHNEISTIEAWWLLACPDEKYRHWIANQWQKNLEVSTQHNKPFTSLEVSVRCKDESIKTFICSAASLVGDFDNSHLVSMYDITDRKHAEEELKKTRNALLESRDRYEDLYEFAPIGYLSLNNHGLIDEVNWKVTALFGLSRKELNQHRFAEFVEEEDKAYWQRTYSDLKTLVGGEELSVDIKLKHSNGNMFYASLNCLRMDDSEEQPILRITLVDITNLKKAEDQLIQSEAYLNTIIENEPECIKVVDAKGYLKQMNPAGLAMLEADSLAQVTGVPLLDFIAPEYQKAFKELHKRVIAGESMQLEFEVIGLKGGRKWLETHAVSILDNNKKLLLGVTRDITERKQTELRIEKLVAQQATILDNKMVGIVIARDRKIVWANLAYEIMFGYSKKELIGMPTKQLYLNEEDYGAIGEAYQNIENEGIVRKQFSFVRKDGEEIWLNLSGSMLDKKTGESLWIFIDMTALKQAEDVASTANNLFKTVIDTAPMRIFWKDTQSRYLGCNPAFAKDADEKFPETIVGKDDFQMPWSEQAALYRADDLTVMQSGIPKIAFEEPQLTPSGNTIWLRTSKVPLKNENNETLGILGIYEDITEQKYAEIELKIAATAFESQDGILIADTHQKILRINRAFTKITGYSAEELIGKNPHILSSGLHTADFYDVMWNSIKSKGTWQGEIWNKRKDGEIYLEYLTITTVVSDDGKVTNYVASISDITQSKLASAEIEQLAFYDPLTGLPNRRLLVDRLNHALSSSKRSNNHGAVLFLDLDHFKSLNDTLGHDVGDLLLKQVSTRLKSCVRDDDTVARLGGDEYVVILENLSELPIEAARQTEVIAHNILSSLNQTYQLATYEHHSTASIGVAIFSAENKSEEELLKHADIAMYQAKKAGRNTLRFFDPKMQEVIQTRVNLENDLRKALEKQQFQLHYQVQMDFLQNPVGVEALIRWAHPEKGLISPFNFIPVLEETGLILQVGQWVLETACAQIKAWEKDELANKLTVSVNVSAKQFRQHDFVNNVKAILEFYAINPMRLKLELTESILLENIEETIISMNKLKEIGIVFSLDDFGTGYSSLQYLKRLPLYQLKIDQSFVRDLTNNNSDQAIVRTIIAMAHMLDLNVIAEGVETTEQQQILLSNGCTHYQGYLYGKPMPVDQLESTLHKHH